MATSPIKTRREQTTINGESVIIVYEYDTSNGNNKITVESPSPIGNRQVISIYENGQLSQGLSRGTPFIDSDGNTTEITRSIIEKGKTFTNQVYTQTRNSSTTPVRAIGQDISIPTTETPDSFRIPVIGDIIDTVNNFANAAFNTDLYNITKFGNDNLKNLYEKEWGRSDKKPLMYPEDILQNGQDLLVITQYEYKSPYNEVFEGKFTPERDIPGFNINLAGAPRASALRNKIGSVYLPIPNNVADTNSVDWGNGSEMSTISMSAAGDIPKVGLALAGGQLLSQVAPTIGAAAGNAFGPLGAAAGSELGKILGNIAADTPLAYSILSQNILNPIFRKSLESLLLKQAGINVSPETLLSRGYGVVLNNNLELLFTGPTLRGFEFGYVMTPRSEPEAKMCRHILRFFKQGMAPKKRNPQNKGEGAAGIGSPSYLLGTPNVFKLQYLTWDSNLKKLVSIEGLTKFKICALTNLSTSYSEGMWSAYEKGQPVRMQIALSFKELEPVYESDYTEKFSSTYETINKANLNPTKDYDAVRPNDVGY